MTDPPPICGPLSWQSLRHGISGDRQNRWMRASEKGGRETAQKLRSLYSFPGHSGEILASLLLDDEF